MFKITLKSSKIEVQKYHDNCDKKYRNFLLERLEVLQVQLQQALQVEVQEQRCHPRNAPILQFSNSRILSLMPIVRSNKKLKNPHFVLATQHPIAGMRHDRLDRQRAWVANVEFSPSACSPSNAMADTNIHSSRFGRNAHCIAVQPITVRMKGEPACKGIVTVTGFLHTLLYHCFHHLPRQI